MYATSTLSCNVKILAACVLLTTYFNFWDCQTISLYPLSLPYKNASSPPCKPPHFKFQNDALLKDIKTAFDMSSIFGNDKTTFLHFNILMHIFAVIRYLTVASLIELVTTIAAYAISGLV